VGVGCWKWNTTTTFSALKGALKSHLEDPYTAGIPGMFKGVTRAIHYYNPLTDLNLAVDADTGAILGGWKLGAKQIWHVLGSSGNLQ
jgi:hypothetical protein